MEFPEDDRRIRKGPGPESMTALRHKALKVLKREESIKVGIKSKRKNAGRDERYLLRLLSG